MGEEEPQAAEDKRAALKFGEVAQELAVLYGSVSVHYELHKDRTVTRPEIWVQEATLKEILVLAERYGASRFLQNVAGDQQCSLAVAGFKVNFMNVSLPESSTEWRDSFLQDVTDEEQMAASEKAGQSVPEEEATGETLLGPGSEDS